MKCFSLKSGQTYLFLPASPACNQFPHVFLIFEHHPMVVSKAWKGIEDSTTLLPSNEEEETVIGVDHKGFVCLCCKYQRRICNFIELLK